MNEPRITWRQTGEARWTGRGSARYCLIVEESQGAWAWSLLPAGSGDAVAGGRRATREDAMVAVEWALRWQINMKPARTWTWKPVRLQFGLRRLFLVTTLAAIFFSMAVTIGAGGALGALLAGCLLLPGLAKRRWGMVLLGAIVAYLTLALVGAFREIDARKAIRRACPVRSVQALAILPESS